MRGMLVSRTVAAVVYVLGMLATGGACGGDDGAAVSACDGGGADAAGEPASGGQSGADAGDGPSRVDSGGSVDSGDGRDAGAGADAATPEPQPEPDCSGMPATPSFSLIEIDAPEVAEPAVKGLSGVAYGNGLFVATGFTQGNDDLAWITSPDGVTWTGHTQSLGTNQQQRTVSPVHFFNGRFIFFGSHFTTGNFVYTSTDGLKWTSTQVQDAAPGVIQVAEFAASDTLTITAGASNDMRRSSDLIEWTAQNVTSGGYSYMDIAYGDGRFMAGVNVMPGLFASADGVAWEAVAGVPSGGAYRVEFGRGTWVVTPTAGLDVWTSPDGETFTQATRPVPYGGSPRFVGGTFLLHSADFFSGEWSAVSATDGVSFAGFGNKVPTAANSGAATSDVAYGNCHFVAAGQYMKDGAVLPLVITAAAAQVP